MTDILENQLSAVARAVLDSVSDGVVVFDSLGRAVYVNAGGRAALDAAGCSRERADRALPRLARMGSRIAPVWVNGSKVCEVVYLPPQAQNGAETLAERERSAIVEMLEQTGWKLTESAQRLGISRTTLWRRLRAYGLDRDSRVRWAR
jgi:transcriptional regulator with PAS, ATPase and Fis domain